MEKTADYKIAAHYLFDLHLPTEKVAEVMGVCTDYVREVYAEESKYRV